MRQNELKKQVQLGKTQKEIGEHFGLSQTCVRHWLLKYGLKTKRSGGNKDQTYNTKDISLARDFAPECFSLTELCRKIGWSGNGRATAKMRRMVEDHGINIIHFSSGGSRRRYPLVEKICPVCENKFETSEDSPREKTTCSHSCSNTYFRSGENATNGISNYRTICFQNHKKKCVVCGEDKIVAVHHYDENHNNNDPSNLIPLCPTHHQYVHSKYKYLVENKIEEYRNQMVAVDP